MSKPPFKLLPISAVISGLIFISPAYAEDETITLPTVEVTDNADTFQTKQLTSPKYAEPILDTAQSITVVPKALIEKQGGQSLRDVFRNISGISLSAGEGNPSGGDQLRIRGFSARDDIFSDGIRDVGIYFRDIFNLESVEVSKGPASTYNGRGSAGGNINLVSKTPRLNNFYNGDLTFGDNDTERLTADINQQLNETTAIRLNILAHDSEVNKRDFIENERYAIAPSIAFGLGTDTVTTLSYFHMRQDNLPDFGIPNVRDNNFRTSPFSGGPAPVDYSNFYGYLNRDYEKVEVDVATAKIEHAFNDKTFIRNQTRYTRAANDMVVSAPRLQGGAGSQITAATTVLGQSKPRDQVDELLINQTDLTLNFNTGSAAHTFITGIELGKQELNNKRRLDTNGPATNLFNPNPSLIANQAAPNGTEADLTTYNASFYVSDSVKLDEKWIVSGGLRYDNVKSVAEGSGGTGALASFNRRDSVSDETVSYRGSVLYKPQSNTSIYAGYGTSFEPLASAAASSAGSFQPAGGNNNGALESGFNLKPEKTDTFEVGAKWDVLDQRLSLTGAVFTITKDNVRNLDRVSGQVNAIGKQRVNGFEIGIAGNITNAWSVFTNYTYLDSEILDSNAPGQIAVEGEDIDNTPRNSFNLWTNYKLPYNIEVGAGALYVDDRRVGANNNTNVAVVADSYWRFDASAGYKLNKNIEFRLNAINLGDRKFIESHGSAQSIPGAGRTVLLTTSFRY